MSVTEVRLHSAGASGNAAGAGAGSVKVSYRSRYRVKCDDPLDGPRAILTHFRTTSTLPWPGRSYKFGNDADGSAECKTVDPERVEKSDGMYDVFCTFEPTAGAAGEEPSDESQVVTVDGKRSDNKLDAHHEIEVTYTQLAAPVYAAKYISGDRGSKWLRALSKMSEKPGSKGGPILNSAGVKYDPPPEKEVHIRIIRITKYVREYFGDKLDPLQGKVNNDDIVIDKPDYKFKTSIKKYTGKIHGIGATFGLQDAEPKKYWRQTTEIHVNPLGWRLEILDEGVHRSALPGEADGKGGTFADGSILAGNTGSIPIKDKNGDEISSPVNLDGKGQPINPATYPMDPLYLTYAVNEEIALAGYAQLLW